MLRRLQQLAFVALASCAPVLAADTGMHAIEAGDPTAILSGCGSSAHVGYVFCRLQEGWAPAGDVVVHVPPVKCGLPSCAHLIVFRPDGGRAVETAIPEGVTAFAIPWVHLLGKDPITQTARGFWPVLLRWVWLNEDGLLEQAAAEGEIRVRVHRAPYRPLTAEPARWQWKIGAATLRMTEKGRAFVEAGGKGPP